MIKNVKSMKEIKSLPYKDGKKYLEDIIKNYKVRDLRKYWGVSDHTWYKKLVPHYKLPSKLTKTRHNKNIEVENKHQVELQGTAITNEKQINIVTDIVADINNKSTKDLKNETRPASLIETKGNGETIVGLLKSLVKSIHSSDEYLINLEINEIDKEEFSYNIKMNGKIKGTQLVRKLSGIDLSYTSNYNLNYSATR